MKQKIKRSVSLLLILCMVITLMPGKVVAAAEGDPINITVQPEPEVAVDYVEENADYAELEVKAVSVSGSALSYQWYMVVKSANAVFPLTEGKSNKIAVPDVLEVDNWEMYPGEYEFYCEISDEEGRTVTSARTKFTVNKGNYTGIKSDEILVKSNTAKTGIKYVLSEEIIRAFYNRGSTKTVINTGDLVTGTPILDPVVGWPWDPTALTFDVKAAAAGASSTIEIKFTNSFFYKDTTFTLTVTASDTVPVNITGMTGENKEYNGTPWKGYTGSPAVEDYAGDYIYHYTGTANNGNPYDSSEAPTNAGNYTLTVSMPADSGYIGSTSIDFSIARREVRVFCTNFTVGRTDDLPDSNWSVQYSGFIGDDIDHCLKVDAVRKYNVSDTNTPGSSVIDFLTQAELNEEGKANYYLTHHNGTLTVMEKSNKAKVSQINLTSAVIDLNAYKITGTVAAGTGNHTVSAVVSEGATWKLYRDAALTQEIADNTVSLIEKETMVYLAVTSESGGVRIWYTVIITKQQGGGQTSPTPPSDPAPVPTSAPSQKLGLDIKGIDGQGRISISNNEKNNTLDITIELPAKSIQTAAGGGQSKDPLVLEIPIASEGIMESIQKSDAAEVKLTLTIPQSLYSQENISISNIRLDQKLMEAARESGKDITLSVADENGRELYGWTFEEKNLAASVNKLTDVNLSLTLQAIGDSQLGQLLNENAVDETKGMVIHFGHEGILPAQASVRIYVGNEYGIEPGDKIYLYHCDPETGKLETLPYSSRYIVDQDGYITVSLVHCSDYAVLPKEAAANQIISLRNQIKVTADKTKLTAGSGKNSTAKIAVQLPPSLELVKNSKDKTSNPALGGVSITFRSSDMKVAIVDEDGLITAKGKGTATVYATILLYSKKTKTFTFRYTVK